MNTGNAYKGPFFAVIVIGVVLIITALLVWRVDPMRPASLSTIERVTTETARAQGLSGRTNIPSDYGMLFVFPHAGTYSFWMKDMQVPIDIIWLSDTYEIIGIEDSVAPDTYPVAFTPPTPVRYVLETRAGEARARGWGIGTQLSLPE